MFEIVIALYLLVIAVLLLSDVARGCLDVVLTQPSLRMAFELVQGWYSAQLNAEFARIKARRSNYENCNWDRCDSLVSSAGKAIAMK